MRCPDPPVSSRVAARARRAEEAIAREGEHAVVTLAALASARSLSFPRRLPPAITVEAGAVPTIPLTLPRRLAGEIVEQGRGLARQRTEAVRLDRTVGERRLRHPGRARFVRPTSRAAGDHDQRGHAQPGDQQRLDR